MNGTAVYLLLVAIIILLFAISYDIRHLSFILASRP
jgi:hypothetical protein